jgi:adenosylhomocysteine nucleosidase
MAFGIDPADQKVGDVLVSTSILTYDDRQIRRSPSGEMEIGFPDRIRYKARAQMLTPLRQEAERRNWAGVRFGSLLSGGAAIHCAQYRDDLVQKLSPVLERLSPDPDERIIGGEMEACGLIASSDPKEPNWVVVKGISDFADENRDAVIEMNRPVACGNAARFLLAALRNFNPGA